MSKTKDVEPSGEVNTDSLERFIASQPEPRKAAYTGAFQALGVIMVMQNVMALLVAPRYQAKYLSTAPRRDQLRQLFDQYLTLVEQEGSRDNDLTRSRVPTTKIRDSLDIWEFGSPVPEAVRLAALECFAAFGISEPEEGWDRWEGPSDEPEPPPLHPRPGILCADPMNLDEWLAYDGPGEFVEGILVEEKASTPREDAIAAWFFATLRDWAIPRGGVVHGRGHKLVVSSTTGRTPDVCVYLPSDPSRDEGAPSIPTLILEVVSASPVDRRRGRFMALMEYAHLGVPWYWILDSSEQLFESLELGSEGRYGIALQAIDELFPAPGLEGLSLDLAALWTAVASPTAPPPPQTPPPPST